MARKGSINNVRVPDEESPIGSRSTWGKKRRRSTTDVESGAESFDDGELEDELSERRRLPGVKRACNECRQQKVSSSGGFPSATVGNRSSRRRLICSRLL